MASDSSIKPTQPRGVSRGPSSLAADANRGSALSCQGRGAAGQRESARFEAPSQSESVQLDEQEVKAYGSLQTASRCPRGYKKVSILGKGGCAIVWLCESLEDPKVKVAAKQFPKSTVFIDSGREELRQNLRLFDLEGQGVSDQHPGA